MGHGSAESPGYSESCVRRIPRRLQRRGKDRKEKGCGPDKSSFGRDGTRETGGTKDIKRLEAQLATIESYLKSYQDAYESYLETHGAAAEVTLTLNDLIWCIKEARGRL